MNALLTLDDEAARWCMRREKEIQEGTDSSSCKVKGTVLDCGEKKNGAFHTRLPVQKSRPQ